MPWLAKRFIKRFMNRKQTSDYDPGAGVNAFVRSLIDEFVARALRFFKFLCLRIESHMLKWITLYQWGENRLHHKYGC